MHAALLAAVHPDNTPHGADLTFAIPVAFFVVVAAALFIRFRTPHAVPGHVALQSSRWFSGGGAGKAAADGQTEVAEDAAAAGTVQSGGAPASGATAGEAAGSGQATPASEGTEDGE